MPGAEEDSEKRFCDERLKIPSPSRFINMPGLSPKQRLADEPVFFPEQPADIGQARE